MRVEMKMNIAGSTILSLFLFCSPLFGESDANISVAYGRPSAVGAEMNSLAPVVSAGYHATPGLYLTGSWGFTYFDLKGTGIEGQRWNPSNIVAAADYLFASGSFYKIRLRTGLAVPLAFFPGSIPENRLAEAGYRTAMAVRGFGDYELWAMNSVPFYGALQAITMAGRFELAAQGKTGYALSLNSLDSYVYGRLALSTGYRAGDFLPGLGLSYFRRSRSLENLDLDQITGRLFVELRTTGYFARLDFLFNLDGPHGIFYRAGKSIGGVMLTTGTEF